jgi:hypothetical protein
MNLYEKFICKKWVTQIDLSEKTETFDRQVLFTLSMQMSLFFHSTKK